MIGQLIWNQDRPDIALDTGNLYGGLHCGECFRCLIDNQWLDIRLEYADDWIFVHNGRKLPVPYGVRVQI